MSSFKLRQELLNDPLARGYAAMTDAECMTSLGNSDRDLPNRESISKDDFYNDILDLGEYDDLQQRAFRDPTTNVPNNDYRRLVQLDMLLKLDVIDLSAGSKALSSLNRIFPNADSPQTRAAIQAYRTRTTSRFDELGIGQQYRREATIAACRVAQPPDGPDVPIT